MKVEEFVEGGDALSRRWVSGPFDKELPPDFQGK
jgi:hypothetical protein